MHCPPTTNPNPSLINLLSFLNDSFKVLSPAQGQSRPFRKGRREPIGAIRPPSCHYCALIEPLYVGTGHYNHFLLLIAHPLMPLSSLHGQFWTPLSAAAWDTDSSHGQRLAPASQGYWAVIQWLNGGSATPSAEGLGWVRCRASLGGDGRSWRKGRVPKGQA